MSLSDILEALLLVTALSADAFIACLSYGSRKILIPVRSAVVISAVCSGILLAALTLGKLICPLISSGVSKGICFTILFAIGALRVFDSTLKMWIRKNSEKRRSLRFSAFKLHFLLEVYAEPEIADLDAGGTLSSSEAALLAAALSLDGAAAGFGAGAVGSPLLFTVALSLAASFLAVKAGTKLGDVIARHLPIDLSPISGLLLIVLAFLKL